MELFDDDPVAFQERSIFWHLASQWKHRTCSAVRQGQFKLIQFLKDEALELHDRVNDPKEPRNLVEEKSEIARQLLEVLVEWCKANGVPLPLESVLIY